VFAARRRVPGHVLLVDDVATTGATLAAAARALRDAGASRVVAVTAARTPAPGTA
jgi:predicted amidophosphoribosyltransferase